MHHICKRNGIVIYPCRGACYAGRLTWLAAQELVLEGKASWFDPPKDETDTFRLPTDPFIVVDGCAHRCLLHRLAQHNLTPEFHLDLADIGIDRHATGENLREQTDLAKDAVMAESTRIIRRPPRLPGCCC